MGIALHEFHSTRRTAFELQKLNVDFAHAGFPSFAIGFDLREPGIYLAAGNGVVEFAFYVDRGLACLVTKDPREAISSGSIERRKVAANENPAVALHTDGFDGRSKCALGARARIEIGVQPTA